jgi:putative ABC transport system permease protein
MLLNYLKHTLRLMVRSPFFTFINIAGLSVGFAVFFILWPFTQAELNSEQFIKDREKIYRTLTDVKIVDGPDNGRKSINTIQPSCFTSTIFSEGQVKDFTRFLPQDFFWPDHTPNLKAYLVISAQNTGRFNPAFKIENAICADSNFFEFFGFPFVEGNRRSALAQGESIVLSKAFSTKLFGDASPIGQLVTVNGYTFQVTGVFKDLPANSHFNFDIVFSNVSKLSYWNDTSPSIFIFSFHYCKTDDSEEKLTEVLNTYKDRILKNFWKPSTSVRFKVEPLSEIVFTNYLDVDRFNSKSKYTLKMLAAIAVVILLMAWMNYTNLTISRTKKRFKEIATRKVSGAESTDLFIQFICQSMMINLLAVLLGVTVVQLIRQPFKLLFNIYIVPLEDYTTSTFLLLGFLFLFGVIICALYPAWITLKYTTRQLISYNAMTENRLLPFVLTTFQYITALILIVLILVSHTQLNFILYRDLGIEKENVVVIEAPVVGLEENGVNKMMSFVEHLKSITHVPMTMSGRVPGDYPYSAVIRRTGSNYIAVTDTYGGTDENFIPFYGLNLIAGRNFQKDEKPNVVLLSKFAAERIGFDSPEDAIGSSVDVNNYDEAFTKAEVIGVFNDYRVMPFLTTQNISEDVTGKGQCFAYMDNLWKKDLPERVSAKIKLSEAPDFIKKVSKLYAETFPGNVFIWYFLDNHINRHYQQQRIVRNQISFFTFLAVGVACLGLLGIIANKVADKTKEISIRKILGAHHLQIATVLMDSTVKQVVIAVVIGVPIAWKLAEEYLARYSEKVQLQWWHYGIPVVMLFSIMFMTVASLLFKATRNNPVDALKCE